MTDKTETIKFVEGYVREAVQKHDSGHGWAHIERVVRLALHIQDCEGKGDRYIIQLGALLHDIGDSKFAAHNGPAEIRRILGIRYIDQSIIDEVVSINENISFSKGRHDIAKSDELKIVQDADRLDAMGAIGIARAFNYGGFAGNEIYDPDHDYTSHPFPGAERQHATSTVNHFYDKLLHLRDLMNTDTGHNLADERHNFMVRYLEQFYREWNAEE